jgi:hypothetical protein
MEAKVNELNELMRTQVILKQKYYEIWQEKRDIEALLNKKEQDNNDCIREVELKIRQLQNELGSGMVLEENDEISLRNELMTLDNILKTDNDDSILVLSYEVPNENDRPYSIDIKFTKTRNFHPASFHIIIKTKCAAVEQIVREVVKQYDNMRYLDKNKLSTEEQEEIDLTTRREWIKNRHNECYIGFKHKKIVEEPSD